MRPGTPSKNSSELSLMSDSSSSSSSDSDSGRERTVRKDRESTDVRKAEDAKEGKKRRCEPHGMVGAPAAAQWCPPLRRSPPVMVSTGCVCGVCASCVQ